MTRKIIEEIILAPNEEPANVMKINKFKYIKLGIFGELKFKLQDALKELQRLQNVEEIIE